MNNHKEILFQFTEKILSSECVEKRLWVASINRSSHVLRGHFLKPAPSFFSLEIFHDYDNSPAYARLYAKPTSNYVPTLIIGDIVKLARFSFWDRVPLYPLRGEQTITLGSETIYFPNEMNTLPLMDSVLALPKLGFICRPSTFVLTESKFVEVFGIPAIAKIHRDIVNSEKSSAFFIHIFASNETTPLYGNTYGFAITNSYEYVSRHPETPFEQI